MRRTRTLFALSAISLALTGCSSDDDDPITDNPPQEPDFANVRVIHASSDAPTVNITANDEILNGLEGVDYQTASTQFEVQAGTYDIGVTANLPGDDEEVLQSDLTLQTDMNYEIFAVGSVENGTLALLPVSNSDNDVADGNAQFQIVHAASAAPTVDIYVTAPDAAIADEQPLVTAAFMDATDPMEMPAGDYRIRITAAGETDVVYDSGTVNLADGADLMVAATNSVSPGDSPVTLVVADGDTSFKLYDVNTPAALRVAHAISGGPAVDVIANNETVLVDGLQFPRTTSYMDVAADTYLIDVVADADNSVVVTDDKELTLETGMYYTAVANNTLDMPELDLLTDMPRSVATEAKVRIIHSSPATGNVDIYVTGDGEISDIDPTFADVPYSTEDLAETGYVGLAEGDYFVTVTAAGSKTAAIETDMLSLENGGVYTAIAADGDMEGDLPQLILLDDLAPPAPPFNADMTYNVTLTGSQEVPAVMTDNTATATVEIDEDMPAFRVTLDASMLSGLTGAHVHDGDIGMNGDVVFPLTANGDGTFMLEATNISPSSLEDLTSGEWYLNVHTEANASGEVRGQIVADTTSVITFPISGEQSVLPVTTDAMGYGYALFDTTSNAVKLTAVTMDLETATAAHIHTGFAGETGGVVAPLMASGEVSGTWMTDGYISLDEETATRLLSGGHYTNFHTPEYPDGEIRGQITPDNIQVYGITATGDQEVPIVDTAAYGFGAFTLNTDTGALSGNVDIFGMMATAAHIHAGNLGENGDVVLGLENDGANGWGVPAETMLTEPEMETMAEGGFYTNFHSTAFPSGEIRGQITLGFE